MIKILRFELINKPYIINFIFIFLFFVQQKALSIYLAHNILSDYKCKEINRIFCLQEMKALLYAAVEQAPSGEVVEPEVVSRYFAKFDEQFFHYCDKELTKINTFYSGN